MVMEGVLLKVVKNDCEFYWGCCFRVKVVVVDGCLIVLVVVDVDVWQVDVGLFVENDVCVDMVGDFLVEYCQLVFWVGDYCWLVVVGLGVDGD